MLLSDFNFNLPSDLIAQRPLTERDASRLLLASRTTDALEDHLFRELPEILRGDELLVFNNSRVLPARLFGTRRGLRSQTPGKDPRLQREYLSTEIEVLLTRNLEGDTWEALVRPGRKISIGERIVFGDGELECEVIARADFGMRRLKFSAANASDDASAEKGSVTKLIERLGHVPLPPYIRRADDPADRERYQTVFAKHTGAVAAPTAGLHFSTDTLDRLRARGIDTCELTLYVGLGTFQPIHTERVEDHPIHSESYEISESTAEKIRNAKSEGRPILAVGTTVVRALEDAAAKAAAQDTPSQIIQSGRAEAAIFMYPGHHFRAVDQLITNFHLPQSSLLVLVAAFAGAERILHAYEHAVRHTYRFYSYGDCMLIR
jgi:S-adenosylmethionine:tRNA ribosyltransferase-isomerase